MRAWDIWRFAHPIISTEQDYHFQILENDKLNCAIALFKLVSTKKRDCREVTPNRRGAIALLTNEATALMLD
jgi:hypothetical protein